MQVMITLNPVVESTELIHITYTSAHRLPLLRALALTRSAHYNADLDRNFLRDMCVVLAAHLLALLLAPAEIIYSWVFNELPSFVAEDSRRFISQETGNLYISKVQPSDVGSYVCQVKNTVTNARVLSPPTPLTLKTDGEILHALHTHTHTCLLPKPPSPAQQN